jgi:hypothetical protein
VCGIELRDAMTLCDDLFHRASYLPEFSGRALVADAWRIRQYQMHPTPQKRD